MEMSESVLELVGNTPLVRFRRIFKGCRGTVAAKLEEFNPTGSVKVRIVMSMIRKAEEEGRLRPGGTIVESTSGNTGIGLAVAGSILGYRVVIVVTDKVLPERVNLMRALGAEVVVCPSDVDLDDERSYHSTVRRLTAEIDGACHLNQNDNPANPLSHYHTTGPEIWRQTDGRITYFVAGIGTGGTITGVGRFLKEKNPKIKVIGVEPEGSLFRSRFYRREPYKRRKSLISGIGETDYIPSNVDFSVYDDVLEVGDEEAFLMARRVVREEGMAIGGSSGAAVAAALKLSTQLNKDDLMVVLLPDGGYLYLSTIYDDDWMGAHGFNISTS